MGAEQKRFEIRLFGGVSISIDGGPPQPMGSTKSAFLLGLLALANGQRISRDKLAARLWPDTDPATGRHNLRQALHALRKTLGETADDLIGADEGSLWLASKHCETDVGRLMTGEKSDKLNDWIEAVDGYAGPLLPGVDDYESLAERGHCETVAGDLLLAIVRHYAMAGDYGSALPFAERLSRVDKLNERSQFAMVKVLVGMGQVSGARRHYTSFSKSLEEALGVSPSISFENVASGSWKQRRGTQRLPVRKSSAATPVFLRRAVIGLVLMCTALVGLSLVIPNMVARSNKPASRQALFEEFDLLSKRGDQESMARSSKVLSSIGELAWRDVYGPRETEWVDLLEPRFDNILDTLEWCSTHEPNLGVKIGGALERYFLISSKNQKLRSIQLSLVLRAKRERTPEFARGVAAACLVYDATDADPRLEDLARYAIETYRVLGDRWGEAHAMRCYGYLLLYDFDRGEEARALIANALVIFRQIGARNGIALCQLCTGIADCGVDPKLDIGSQAAIRIRALIESFDLFDAASNYWGTSFTSSVIADRIRLLKHSPERMTLWRDCRTRMDRASEIEAAKGNILAVSLNQLVSIRLSVLLGDKAAISSGMARIASGMQGITMEPKVRYCVFRALRRYDRRTYETTGGDTYLKQLLENYSLQHSGDETRQLVQSAERLSIDEVLQMVLD